MDDVMYHSTKTAKIFLVTLDGATHGASISCPMHSYIYGYPEDFCCFSGVIHHIVLTMSFKLVSFFTFI